MSYPEEQIYSEVAREVERAQALFAPMHSAHEAAAVILEEYEEFWDEVKRKERDYLSMRKELIQLAAMAIRAILDLRLDDPVPEEGR